MKKIAMLNCLKANEICTGAACMSALNRRKASFERYSGEEVSLVAFMRCNGCEVSLQDDKGMQEKIERLRKIETDIVHVGICTKDRSETVCRNVTEIVGKCQEKRTPKNVVKYGKLAPSAKHVGHVEPPVCAPCPPGVNTGGSTCHAAPGRRSRFRVLAPEVGPSGRGAD